MKSKRHFADLIKAFYAQDFQDMYNYIPNLSDTEDENYEKEVTTFNKNGVESTVTTYFNSKGLIVGTVSTSKGTINKNESELTVLNKRLATALEEEDYRKAAEIN